MGLVGALVGMGIPEYEAKRYEGRVKDGGILLSVHCDSSEEISRAKEILKATGADDVASSGEKAVSTHGVESGHTNVCSSELGAPCLESPSRRGAWSRCDRGPVESAIRYNANRSLPRPAPITRCRLHLEGTCLFFGGSS